VAARAGVALGTASNAFNRPDRISKDLREHVLQAAEQLGYTGPDPSARRLRTGRSGALGLLFTDSLEYAFTDQAATLFLRGVAGGLGDSGLLIIPATETTQAVREAAVDGFLVYSTPTNDPRTEAALARGLPTVTVDQPRDTGTPFVGIDDRAAARDAAVHLRDLGHTKIAVLSFADSAGGEGTYLFDVTRERQAGYQEGGAGDVYICLPNSPATGRTAALEAIDAGATAVVAMSDAIALGAQSAARERGAALSVVGFDDSPAAALADPPLTTIAQPLALKGETAAGLLTAAIAGTPPASRRRILPHQLIVRGSTAPPGSRPTWRRP
jgi:DNA-binding LacI/PurR family transcriptional regulator